MPLSLSDIFGMAFRQTPIGKIRKALAKCEGAGIAVTAKDLEAHALCGQDPLVLADALVTAQQLGVTTSFQEMAAVSLVGKDPFAVLLEASKEHTVSFDTFSPKQTELLRGFTRGQEEVFAVVTLVYRLSLHQLTFHFDPSHVHERLGAAISVYINTAPDLRTLRLRQSEHEAQLAVLGLDLLPGLRSVTVEFR